MWSIPSSASLACVPNTHLIGLVAQKSLQNCAQHASFAFFVHSREQFGQCIGFLAVQCTVIASGDLVAYRLRLSRTLDD